jgi:hypothetical protein
MRTLTLVLVSICAAVALAVPAANASNAPVRLTFDKTAVASGVWQGTVSGDVTGGLTTKLLPRDDMLARDETGPILHVTFDWIVDAGPSSFTARLSGILNTQTGAVVMNGNVIAGAWLGAEVHEEGQLVNPVTSQFTGSIRVMPATA